MMMINIIDPHNNCKVESYLRFQIHSGLIKNTASRRSENQTQIIYTARGPIMGSEKGAGLLTLKNKSIFDIQSLLGQVLSEKQSSLLCGVAFCSGKGC